MRFALVIMALATAVPAGAKSVEQQVGTIAKSTAFKTAAASLDSGHDRFVDEVIEITEIPAPPFAESERGKAIAAKFSELGLTDVTTDVVGNVTALRPGIDPRAKLVVVSAHLDTVFPADTSIKVKREGTRLIAPGIGDDSRGLAALLAYARALDAGKIKTRAPILFVATVGEEGAGDLRGVKHLFNAGPYKGRIGSFISVDGTDASRLVDGGTGSKRYHVIFRGPGGHSFGAFGMVNPIAAMSLAVTRLYEIKLPAEPKTTFSASVTGGGTSVNSIPAEVFMDFDLRSNDQAALDALDVRFKAIIEAAVADENAARSTNAGKVSAELQLIGDRPAGRTPRDSILVQVAGAALTAHGYEPSFEAQSTDSNTPMGLGIPAITIGSGGKGGGAHGLSEWIDVARPESVRGLSAGLLTVLAAAGIGK